MPRELVPLRELDGLALIKGGLLRRLQAREVLARDVHLDRALHLHCPRILLNRRAEMSFHALSRLRGRGGLGSYRVLPPPSVRTSR